MPRGEKPADIVDLIELTKKSKAEGGSGKLSDQIVKVVNEMQHDITDGKLEAEKLFQKIAKMANSIMNALLNKYVEEHSDPERHKQAVALVQDLNMALIKREILTLRLMVNKMVDFKWQNLNRETKAREESASVQRESQTPTPSPLIIPKPSEADTMAKKVETLNRYCINELYSTSESGTLLSSKLSEFTKKFLEISGNDIVDQFSIIRSLFMMQMRDMQQLIGQAKPENSKEEFLRGYNIMAQLLVPTLQSTILNNSSLKVEEVKSKMDAAMSSLKRGTSDFISRPGAFFHMADYDDISAGLRDIQTIIEKQVSKNLSADGSKPKTL